jgi:acetylornithine deacetylase/succinyl-diaminopimelate desuccinylase-like protein
MIDTTVKEALIRGVDVLKDELIQLTADTVRIPSINPTYPGQVYTDTLGGETEVNEFVKPLLEGLGMTTDLWEEEEGRANLVGVLKGTGGGKSLIFNGHVDVVPPGPDEDW